MLASCGTAGPYSTAGREPRAGLAYAHRPEPPPSEPRAEEPSEPRLSIDDVGLLVCDVFRCRCVLTGARYDSPDRPGFRLCRWDPSRPATLDNMLFATNAATEQHELEGPHALHPDLVAEIQRSFAAALHARRQPIFHQELLGAVGDGSSGTTAMA